MHPNVETFIGCDSSYRAASIVLYGAPYDSTTSYRPGARFGPCLLYTSITVVKHYIDRALSAKTDNRPDFQQMIKDSEKRLFDIVLVWKLDRFRCV